MSSTGINSIPKGGTIQELRRMTAGRTIRVIATIALFLGFAAGAGCEATLKPLGEFTTANVSGMNQLEPIPASELFPLEAHSGVYERTSGDDSSREYEYELRRREGKDWIFELEDRHRVYLRQEPDGSIGLYRYKNLRRDMQIDAEPAIKMLPAELDGQAYEGSLRLTMHGLLGRSTMRGESRYRLQLTGTRIVKTPEGERQAYIIEQKQQVRMPLAWVEIHLETAYVPGVGRVLENLRHEYRVLGLFGNESQESYRRIR